MTRRRTISPASSSTTTKPSRNQSTARHTGQRNERFGSTGPLYWPAGAGLQAYGVLYGVRVMRSTAGCCNTRRMENTEILRRRLEQAKVRRDAGAPYSPDWDAAMAQIDDLAARLARLAILARALPRVPAAA